MLERILAVLLPWLIAAGILAAVAIAALVAHWLIYRVLGSLTARTSIRLDDSFIRRSRRPAKWILPLLAVSAALPALVRLVPAEFIPPARHAISLALIAALAWLLVSLLGVIDDAVALKFPLEAKDNLAARRVLTQVQVLQRIATAVIAIVTVSIMLMTFPEIRTIGTSLLASAGLAGLVVGLAARPALENLLAGVQVALTEPFRIDDVVIVEGEWGRIEEIRNSYVVVRIWDLRRLVVPISYFIQKPFQNWTRTTANLLGTVFVYADYTVPVEAVREELGRMLERSRDLWDGTVWGLQVTDAKERTLELRALVSAANSDALWDLRCRVREQLVDYLKKNFPGSLPRLRAEMQGGVTAGPGRMAPSAETA